MRSLRIALCLLVLAGYAGASTYYMLLGDGQSLSTGNYGCNAISTAQYGSNQMYSGSALVPLVESGACSPYLNAAAWAAASTFQPFSTATYSGTEYATLTQTTGVTPPSAPCAAVNTTESPLSAAMNNFTALTGVSGIATNFGQGGQPITTWGSASAISNIATKLTAIKALLPTGSNLVVIGVLVQGGESDYTNQGVAGGCYAAGVTAYYANNICFQQSLQMAIQGATGQSTGVPVIYSQMSSMMGHNTYSQTCPDGTAQDCIDTYPVNSTVSHVPIAQYQLARDSANAAVCGTSGYPACGMFYLVGPKYHLDSGSAQGPHLSALGYNMLGAESARILACLYQVNFRYPNSCSAGVMPQTPIFYSGNKVTFRVSTPGGISLDQPGSAATTTGNWANGVIPVPY